jgi:hypothetical protein
MKKGEGETKHCRRITISVTAAISPDESNWGWRGGCLAFLVYLFSDLDNSHHNVHQTIHTYVYITTSENYHNC